MDCHKIESDELLDKYLLDRLEPGAQDALETHLIECAACARELELRLLAQSALAEKQVAIRTRTVQRFSFFRWRPLAVAAMLLMLIGGGYFYRFELRSKLIGGQKPQVATATPGPTSPNENVLSPAPPVTTLEAPTTASAKPSQPPNPKPPTPAPQVTAAAKPEKNDKDQGQIEPGEIKMATTEPPLNQNPAVEPGPLVGPPKSAGKNTGTKTDPAALGLTSEQGVELYKLGQTQAPPFVFPGQVPGAKIPYGVPTQTYGKSVGDASAGRALFEQGMNAYIAGQYVLAADHLRDALNYEPSATDINFYLGICNLLQGHPEAAIGPFQKAAVSRKAPYGQSSHYYLAKAYIQLSKLPEAEAELSSAIAAKGQLTTEAKALLKKVQALQAEIQKN